MKSSEQGPACRCVEIVHLFPVQQPLPAVLRGACWDASGTILGFHSGKWSSCDGEEPGVGPPLTCG